MAIGQIENNFIRKQEYDTQKTVSKSKDTEAISGVIGQEAEDQTELFKAVEKLLESDANKMKLDQKELRYSIHKDTKQIMVKIVDTETDEVIKEIPSEKILDMVATMCREAGLFVDERV